MSAPPLPQHVCRCASAACVHVSLPDAVLVYLADSFLLDSDAVRCARTRHSTFHALRRYRVKSELDMDTAIQLADGSSIAEEIRATAEGAVTHAAQEEGRDGDVSSSLSADSPSDPPPLRSPWRIGVLQRVTAAVDVGDRAPPQLRWLPRSVTEVRLSISDSSEHHWLVNHLPPALRSLTVEDSTPQPADG